MLEAKIERNPDGTHTVTRHANPSILNIKGVTCLNPNDPEGDRLYEKTFLKKKIYLPDEFDKAVAENLTRKDSFIISMNGYSTLKPENCRRYGVQEGDYEEACKAILSQTIKNLQKEFPATDFRVTHGASDMGVDKAIQEVSARFNLDSLGFSCPEWMPYVLDDDAPVYVGNDSDDYAEKYIRTLDLLICTGGREQALKHDVIATIKYNKRIHFIDVLNILSSTGGVPATILNLDGSISIDNAAAAMGRNVSFFSMYNQ